MFLSTYENKLDKKGRKFGIEEILTGESNGLMHSFAPQLKNE